MNTFEETTDPSMDLFSVSVIVVSFNEEHNIGPCLDSLLRQTYHARAYEIVVVDGGSWDQTATIVENYAQNHPQIRLVVEPRKGTAIGRNAGIHAARFPHIAFIDADCEAAPHWLERLTQHFITESRKDPAVVAVGGGNVPPSGCDPFMEAVGVAADSFAGSFNSSQGRRFQTTRPVVSLATLNVLYEKQPLLDVGGFDVSLGSEAEDAEMNYRLYMLGRQFMFIPDLPVLHKFRPTPAIWGRNMLRYGRGRARLLKRYPAMWDYTFALPPAFLLSMTLLLLAPVYPIFWLSLAYFPSILILSLKLCLKQNRLPLIGHVLVVFIVQHFAYAWGETMGLLNPRVQ